MFNYRFGGMPLESITDESINYLWNPGQGAMTIAQMRELERRRKLGLAAGGPPSAGPDPVENRTRDASSMFPMTQQYARYQMRQPRSWGG